MSWQPMSCFIILDKSLPQKISTQLTQRLFLLFLSLQRTNRISFDFFLSLFNSVSILYFISHRTLQIYCFDAIYIIKKLYM